MAGDFIEPLREQLAQPRALQRVVEFRIKRIDVRRQPPLAPEVIKGVLKGRKNILWVERKARRHTTQKHNPGFSGQSVIVALFGIQARIGP